MALLAEIDLIERQSVMAVPTDPETGEPDTGHPDHAAIVAAGALRSKIRAALLIHARALLGGASLEIEGRDSYPQAGGETNEAIGWAQAVLQNVDLMLPAAFRLALVSNPDVNTDDPFTSVAFLRGLGTSTDYSVDTALRAAFIPLLPLLAKGSHPGR